jgi:ElaB/YqjD/DUF883 family membrane-anchored ribosome-binding protein
MKTEQYTEKMQEYTKPLMSKVSDRFSDVQERVGETARNLGQTTDEYVHSHPWQTVAIVAIVACLIGFLSGRGRD